MTSLDDSAQTIVHEVDALMRSLPTDTPQVKKRFIDEYHQLVDELENATGSDLTRFRIEEDEIQSAADRMSDVLSDQDLGSLPESFRAAWQTPEVSVDVIRAKGNRLVAFFHTRMRQTAVSEHHITISGNGNQMVVGIAGGSLDQSVTYTVGSGDDRALLDGLEKLGINEELLAQLANVIEVAPDDSAKRDGVRAWMKDFVSDTLSGTLSSAAASQLPSAIALAIGYLA